MNVKLIVTESDGGDSLNLPGEWSAEAVDYDDDGNSVTTYEFEDVDKRAVEHALDDAGGVVSYRWAMTTYETVALAAARLHVHESSVRRLAARDLALGVKGIEKFGRSWRLASDWQPVRVPVGHPRNEERERC